MVSLSYLMSARTTWDTRDLTLKIIIIIMGKGRQSHGRVLGKQASCLAPTSAQCRVPEATLQPSSVMVEYKVRCAVCWKDKRTGMERTRLKYGP